MRRTLPVLSLGIAALAGCAALSALRLSPHGDSTLPLFLFWLFAPVTLLWIAISSQGVHQPWWEVACALGAILGVAGHPGLGPPWALRSLTIGLILWFLCLMLAVAQFV